MADYSPLTEEEKQEKRLRWWKERLEEAAVWRACPMPGCPQQKYRYSSRSALVRHLQRKHGAS